MNTKSKKFQITVKIVAAVLALLMIGGAIAGTVAYLL